MTIKNVELTKKANIYFDGNVTSRTFIDENGFSLNRISSPCSNCNFIPLKIKCELIDIYLF